jgi:hypothetical protein
MKLFLLLFSLTVFYTNSNAQNIGIGNPNPTEKLDVMGQTKTDGLKITNNNAIELGVGIAGKESNAGKIGYGLFTTDYIDFVGAGTSSTNRKIRFWAEGGSIFEGGAALNGNVNTTGGYTGTSLFVRNASALNTGITNTISFGGNNYSTGFISTIGTSASAARMGFSTGYSFTGGASNMFERLTILNNGNIGVGNINPANKLDINGDINTTGLVKLNGNTGNAGQVLTSSGATAPTWANTAYGNNTRVLVIMGENATVANGSIINTPITSTLYNTNPTDITVNAEYLTINKSGLYHFDLKGNYQFQNLIGVTPDPVVLFYLEAGYGEKIPLPTEYSPELTGVVTTTSPNRSTWKTAVNVSYDVYITAPANIGFQYNFPPNTYGVSTKASLGAYLIHE